MRQKINLRDRGSIPFKLRFYQWLNRWAVIHVRRMMNNDKIYSPRARVTDHALLRYLERIEGRDIDGLRAQLLSQQVRENIHKLGGNGKFVLDGVLYTIVRGTVVTVAKPNKTQAVWSGLHRGGKVPRKWSF